jgi:hypothetical protein
VGDVFTPFLEERDKFSGGNQRHGKTAGSHDPVNNSFRKIDGGHTLMMGPLGEFYADYACKGKKRRVDERNQDEDPFYRFGRQIAVKKLQVNMRAFSDTGDRSDKSQQYEQISGNLFSPGEGTVKDIAAEELDKNDDQQGPEDDEDRGVDPLDVGYVIEDFNDIVVIVFHLLRTGKRGIPDHHQ